METHYNTNRDCFLIHCDQEIKIVAALQGYELEITWLLASAEMFEIIETIWVIHLPA